MQWEKYRACHVLNQYPGRRIFVVDALVAGVRDLSCLVDEYAVVRPHARVDHAEIGRYEADLGRRLRVNEG